MLQRIRTMLPIACALLLLGLGTAQAGEGRDQLDAFFDGLDALRADFFQTLLDEEDAVIEKSEGVLLVDRPGRFRLQYSSPYEQLYVADGERVWMYDKELDQVTVRGQEAALGNTPALLLSDPRPLEETFEVNELGVVDGVAWVELLPKERQEGGFERIRMGLKGGAVRLMEMRDPLGQVTRLRFVRLERNPVLAAEAFVFEPPPGVDVIDADQR